MGMVFTVIAPWLLAGALLCAIKQLERTLTPYTYLVSVTAASALLAIATWTTWVALGAVMMVTELPVALTAVGYALIALAAFRLAVVMRHWHRVAISLAVSRSFSRARTIDDDVVVIEDPAPDAFAVRTGRGAIVITTGMQAALPAAELAVVIAHERAHLRFRHSYWVQTVESAAALNPILRPLAASVRLAVERHADECAAQLGRSTALRAVARASLLATRPPRLAAVGIHSKTGDAIRRARALSEPPIEGRQTAIVASVVAVAIFAGVLGGALADVAQDCFFPEPGHSPTDVFR